MNVLFESGGVKFYAFNLEGNYSLPTYYKLEADRVAMTINLGLDLKMNDMYLAEIKNQIFSDNKKNEEKLSNISALIDSMEQRNKLALNYDNLIELAAYYCYTDKEVSGCSVDEFKAKKPDSIILKEKIKIMAGDEQARFFFLNFATLYITAGDESKMKDLVISAQKNSHLLQNLPAQVH